MKRINPIKSLCVLLFICDQIFASLTWDYGKHGPNVWKDINSNCGGQNQSPINIKTGCTKYEKFDPFHLTSSHQELIKIKLTNNGHTIVGEAIDTPLSLTGANLNGKYLFQSFHLHWGPNYNTGSEHQINGDQYAGESHFVYRNEQIDQFAVLSFLMESRNVTNDGKYSMKPLYSFERENQWEMYFDAAQNLIHENDSTIMNLTLSLLMGENFDHFWRYSGSLTIPPCTENVMWTVFNQSILILNYDFELFRDDLFFQSYRGPQPLYDRKVLRSFPEEYTSSIPDQKCCSKGSKNEIFFSGTLMVLFLRFF